tara:strand:- start:233 stop:508 length:276 start_codon:yes stop_codon:yes gene_type:complete
LNAFALSLPRCRIASLRVLTVEDSAWQHRQYIVYPHQTRSGLSDCLTRCRIGRENFELSERLDLAALAMSGFGNIGNGLVLQGNWSAKLQL